MEAAAIAKSLWEPTAAATAAAAAATADADADAATATAATASATASAAAADHKCCSISVTSQMLMPSITMNCYVTDLKCSGEYPLCGPLKCYDLRPQ